MKTSRLGLRPFFTLLSLVLFALPLQVSAIPFGTIDFNDEYPYVGALGTLVDDVYYTQRATGVLIAPNVVLTAAHVTTLAAESNSNFVFMTGAQPLDGPESITTVSSAVLHPLWDPDRPFESVDLGLLFLSSAVNLDRYAWLAPDALGSLVGASIDVVGYGSHPVRRFASSTISEMVNGDYLSYDPYAYAEGGDSGGGMFIERDGVRLLAGTPVWVIPSPYLPTTAFEPVAAARSFIDQYVPDAYWYGETVSVPEPGTLALMLAGLAGIAGVGRRRRCTME